MSFDVVVRRNGKVFIYEIKGKINNLKELDYGVPYTITDYIFVDEKNIKFPSYILEINNKWYFATKYINNLIANCYHPNNIYSLTLIKYTNEQKVKFSLRKNNDK